MWGPHGGDVVRKARLLPADHRLRGPPLLDGLGDLPSSVAMGSERRTTTPGSGYPDPGSLSAATSSCRHCPTPARRSGCSAMCWSGPRPSRRWLPSTGGIISGHGGVFQDHGVEMLLTTARALRFLDGEVVRRLNEGQWQEQILYEVELPAELAASSYLQPLYGCTAFLVRDLMRRYMGWYDGNPSMLFPSTRAVIAPRWSLWRVGPDHFWTGPGLLVLGHHRRCSESPSPGRLRAIQRRASWSRGPCAEGRSARGSFDDGAFLRGPQHPRLGRSHRARRPDLPTDRTPVRPVAILAKSPIRTRRRYAPMRREESVSWGHVVKDPSAGGVRTGRVAQLHKLRIPG